MFASFFLLVGIVLGSCDEATQIRVNGQCVSNPSCPDQLPALAGKSILRKYKVNIVTSKGVTRVFLINYTYSLDQWCGGQLKVTRTVEDVQYIPKFKREKPVECEKTREDVYRVIRQSEDSYQVVVSNMLTSSDRSLFPKEPGTLTIHGSEFASHMSQQIKTLTLNEDKFRELLSSSWPCPK